MNTPLISIIIPTYNSANFVGDAIKSAINQTYENIEIILTDNFSTDDTYTICKSYEQKDKRIRCFQNSENIGMVRNWNEGLKKANGKFFVLLCSDDWLEINILEKYLEQAHENYIQFSNSMLHYVDENIIQSYQNPFKQEKVSVYKIIWKLHGIPLSSILYPRLEGEFFNENLNFNCDLEYLLRLALKFKYGIYYNNTELVNIRLHKNNETKKFKLNEETLKLLKIINSYNINICTKFFITLKQLRIQYA